MKEQQRVPVIERVFRREPTMADTESRCDTNPDQPLRGAHPGCVVGAPAVGDGSQARAAVTSLPWGGLMRFEIRLDHRLDQVPK